jgi:hypothetical protein
MQVKIHSSYRDIVAICDSELLGKRFEEGKFQLDIKENFFSGEEKTPEEVIKLIQDFAMEDATFNIVGQSSIDAATKAGIISEKEIGKVQEVPFALVLL